MEESGNRIFDLAVRYVLQTGSHLFITGKAGTGKTTFLKHIRDNCPKNLVVVAPTGVAAINAGGVTIHSFFQLPFGTFLPGRSFSTAAGERDDCLNPQTLISGMRINASKKKIFQELDMVIIDEVSMLRADVLDAIDTILRHFRRNPYQPFGGVQMIYIGDLYQLPPVVVPQEWNKLRYFYPSPFFFEAKVIAQATPLYIELKKIYRQHEPRFINLLNMIRNNRITPDELQMLNQFYQPDFLPPESAEFITLTTHNARADTINSRKLAELPGQQHGFRGEVTGEFNDKVLPAELNLQLKKGAQVMFIKNDKGENRRYYNGKLGIVTRIDDKGILVKLSGSETELLCERETWRNIRYVLDEHKNRIEEEEIGSYTQYPLRLAWAITIHKSQGLTFEKAIIDAGASFAPGQVYVALSRLTSLQGLVLGSPILSTSISTDHRIIQFCTSRPEPELVSLLKHEEHNYFHQQLLSAFNMTRTYERIDSLQQSVLQLKISDKEQVVAAIAGFYQMLSSLHDVSLKFIRQLEYLLEENQSDRLYQRLQDGGSFFGDALIKLEDGILEHACTVGQEKKNHRYLKTVNDLQTEIYRKRMEIGKMLHLSRGLQRGEDIATLQQGFQPEPKREIPVPEKKSKEKKPEKGETRRITLHLFREGHTVPEIAEYRKLASSTIETHLARLVSTGDIELEELVSPDKVAMLTDAFTTCPDGTLTQIKELVGDSCSYAEIRAVSEFLKSRVQQDCD